MADNIGKGDKVSWQSHGSETTGKVEKKITEDTEEAGRTVRADQDEIRQDFGDAVNMTPGERIATILGQKKNDLTDEDFAHMRKVIGYVKRHRAQRPEHEDIKDSRWRYSLMNWGHDPLKK